jgi:hypothetical protein
MVAGAMRGRQRRETRARRAAARAPSLRALQYLVSGESCPTSDNRRRKLTLSRSDFCSLQYVCRPKSCILESVLLFDGCVY